MKTAWPIFQMSLLPSSRRTWTSKSLRLTDRRCPVYVALPNPHGEFCKGSRSCSNTTFALFNNMKMVQTLSQGLSKNVQLLYNDVTLLALSDCRQGQCCQRVTPKLTSQNTHSQRACCSSLRLSLEMPENRETHIQISFPKATRTGSTYSGL